MSASSRIHMASALFICEMTVPSFSPCPRYFFFSFGGRMACERLGLSEWGFIFYAAFYAFMYPQFHRHIKTYVPIYTFTYTHKWTLFSAKKREVAKLWSEQKDILGYLFFCSLNEAFRCFDKCRGPNTAFLGPGYHLDKQG